MDIWSILVIVIMVIISLTIGHSLGGQGIRERSVLAVACLARNIGLSLFIITLNDNPAPFIPILFSYMIIGAIVGIPYSKWSKKQLATAQNDKPT